MRFRTITLLPDLSVSSSGLTIEDWVLERSTLSP
jgi:hypothetical protein